MIRPDSPRVSVVVITRNRRGDLHRALTDLTALPERPLVIVIDNGSDDGTSAMVREEFPRVRLHRLEENRGASSRNIGVREAATPYVAFCDDDMSWEPGSLAGAAELLDRHERLALITARILVGAERKVDPVCADMATSPLPIDPGLPGYPVISFMAGGTIVRRAAFLAVGGFERRFQVGGEERLMAVDLMARGWAMAYVPELVALHRPSPSRDPGSRARIQIRNHLWFTWLRRPIARALSETWRIARQAGRQEAARRALIEAGRELAWVLRHRATLPADVESRLLVVERATDAGRYL